jgi:hypothetical protein
VREREREREIEREGERERERAGTRQFFSIWGATIAMRMFQRPFIGWPMNKPTCEKRMLLSSDQIKT